MNHLSLRTTVLTFSLFALGLSGCFGSARVVQRNQVGGVLALQGAPQKSNADAQLKMTNHCGPGNFTVVEESEMVVGSSTEGSRGTTAVRGLILSTGSSKTRDTTEPRLSYVCNTPATQYAPPTPYGYAPPPTDPAAQGMPYAQAYAPPAAPPGQPLAMPAAYYYPPAALPPAPPPAPYYAYPPQPSYYPSGAVPAPR